MIKTNNAGGRLHQLLEAAKAADNSFNGYQTWVSVFKVQDFGAPANKGTITEASNREAVLKLIQLSLLVDETIAGINNIEGLNKALYLKPFDRIRDALSLYYLQNSNYPQTILGQITEGDMTVLAFCAEALANACPEPEIEEEQIKELLSNISILYEDVQGSDLNEELRNLILDQLEIIRRAVHEYRIRGVARLREALNTVVGAYILNEDLIRDEEAKEVTDYRGVLSRFAAVVSFASNSTKLIEAAATYIPRLLPGG